MIAKDNYVASGCACLAFAAFARAFPAMACKAVFSLFRPLFRSAAMGQVRLGASKTSRTYPNVGIQEIKPRYGCVGCKLVPYKTLSEQRGSRFAALPPSLAATLPI